ncbi:MAG: GntR family transcriptional regulator [Pseudomonadota bacterium]
MSRSTEKAYFQIREMILEGEFLPGDHLSEEQLSNAVGVSRTPVRDALRRLENDFFVTIQTNRGARVRSWSREDIDDLFQLRAMLEGFAAKRAAQRATKNQIDMLYEEIARINAALSKKGAVNVETFLDANANIHRIICEASGNKRLVDMIDALVAQAVVVRTAKGYSSEELRRSNLHHKDMADAIAAGNADLAENIMKLHILAAEEAFKAAAQPSVNGQSEE